MEEILERRVRVIPAARPAQPVGLRQERQRVAAYCRVSTDSEEQLSSYAAQKAYYTQRIEENPDWKMAGVFADEGLSGTGMKKRTEFNRMIAACKRGRIDLILTKSLSRFARNTVDCLNTVRMLKANGIGVIFEKENINTLTESSEFLITLFSGFAQAESESLSKNVVWGKQKSMEAGHVTFQYKKLLGYRRGPDGKPEIVPEAAETVRRIYRRYLEGASLVDLQRELEQDGILPAEGVRGWSRQVLRNILTNEKYIGDALLQKTYVTDCISKKVVKNTGGRAMYYVENNHPAIISKEIFHRVQAEMTRRSSKRKVMQKSGKTEQGKYSAKYALSELLVCGECGTPYKRCTWTRNGKKRIVWRCVSRLEFGKKYCHNSPTMDESKLHSAIVATLNEYGADRAALLTGVRELTMAVKCDAQNGSQTDLKRRLDALNTEQAGLIDKILKDMDSEELNARLQAIAGEKQTLLAQIEEARQAEAQKRDLISRQKELEEWLEHQPLCFTEYDDTITRRLIERITVQDADTIRVQFRGAEAEIEQPLN
ncbi:MAG: recombinase family protein [Oscillospiraceae bacterium]|nr:recombinase family protein [Oscillospiraceae bacterium]